MRAAKVCICCTAIALLASPAVVARPSKPPASAQDALARGMTAVQRRDWDAAINWFKRAREISPESPRALLNLGSAVKGRGGSALAVTAWYRAYLAAAPGALNADRVEVEILALEKGVRAEITEHIQTVRKARELEHGSKLAADRRLARIQADIGLFDEALAIARRMDRLSLSHRASLFAHIARRRAERGDKTAARSTLRRAIEDEAAAEREARRKNKTRIATSWPEIARVQAKLGDIAAATETAAKAAGRAGADSVIPAFEAIAIAQANDAGAVQKTLALMYSHCKSPGRKIERQEAHVRVGLAVAEHGDLEQVSAIMRKLDFSGMLPDQYLRPLAKVKAASGDVKGALAVVDRMSTGGDRSLRDIVHVLARRGDFAKATEVAERVREQSAALAEIAIRRVERGNVKGALGMLDTIPEHLHKANVLLKAAVARAAAGDRAGFAKSTIGYWSNLGLEYMDMPPGISAVKEHDAAEKRHEKEAARALERTADIDSKALGVDEALFRRLLELEADTSHKSTPKRRAIRAGARALLIVEDLARALEAQTNAAELLN